MKKNRLGIKNIILFTIIIFVGLGAYYYYSQNKRTTVASIYDTYRQLENYLKSSGYTCSSLLEAGSSCKKEANVNTFEFLRYDDGLQYISTSKNYKINLTNRQAKRDFYIITYANALPGYENKQYYCETENETVLGQLVKCETEDKEVLDNQIYVMAVRNALIEVDNILENSGYNASKLVSIYKWTK